LHEKTARSRTSASKEKAQIVIREKKERRWKGGCLAVKCSQEQGGAETREQEEESSIVYKLVAKAILQEGKRALTQRTLVILNGQ